MTMKSEPFGRAICEALGLPLNLITAVHINAIAGEALSVCAEMKPTLSAAMLEQVKTMLAESNEKINVTLLVVGPPLASALPTDGEERGDNGR